MRNGYGHMVLDDYVERVRAMRCERAERLAAIRSPEQALAYAAAAKQAIARAFQPVPPRTPLNARVTGVVERGAYRIERLLYESRPGFLVSANLYVPAHLNGPAPCVLGACGHSALGKATPLYQGFCQRLVASGFVVLIYDPVSQGERDQYIAVRDREEGQRVSREHNTAAHNMMGKQLELVGEYLGMWRAWDGIRGLDYLLSRPEVDPRRVGLTGNSGGGTMTTWLWAIEDRFTMAAPSCFVTTFLNNLENELPADCEQYPPGVLAQGIEMVDFMLAQAPKPVLLLGQHYDFFDRRGHQEAYDEFERVYRILGAPEGHCACFRGPHTHGFYVENQEAMVAFFARHAGVQVVPLAETEALDEAQLWATSTGQVLEAGSRPIYDLIAERVHQLEAERPAIEPQDLARRLGELLGLPPRDGKPHYRILRPTRVGAHTYGRYAVETERGIRAILRKRMADPELARSLDVSRAVRLFLPHCASEEDLQGDPLARHLQEEGEFYALDVRGLGESRPDEEESFWHVYGLDYMFHGHALLFSESYLGRRVFDVLRTLDLLVAEGAAQVELYGRGQGALLALLAACLHPAVGHVTLRNGPTRYSEWAQAPLVAWPAANGLRGVLQHLDLDRCLEALGDRVTVVEPWGVDMRPLASDSDGEAGP